MSRRMTKPAIWPVHPVKTQISLGTHPVWSESSLSAWRNIGPLTTYWVPSKDSDQTGRMPRLIWVVSGRTGHFFLFFHAAAHKINNSLQQQRYLACVDGLRMDVSRLVWSNALSSTWFCSTNQVAIIIINNVYVFRTWRRKSMYSEPMQKWLLYRNFHWLPHWLHMYLRCWLARNTLQRRNTTHKSMYSKPMQSWFLYWNGQFFYV